MKEKDFEYYLENQDQLVAEYNGLHLVIADRKVIGAYATIGQAYDEGRKKCGIGNFIIQKCSPGTVDYTQNFYSLVKFS